MSVKPLSYSIPPFPLLPWTFLVCGRVQSVSEATRPGLLKIIIIIIIISLGICPPVWPVGLEYYTTVLWWFRSVAFTRVEAPILRSLQGFCARSGEEVEGGAKLSRVGEVRKREGCKEKFESFYSLTEFIVIF